MIRFIASAAAAVILTTGAVAALAEPAQSDQPKVTFDQKSGKYCITTPAEIGTRIPKTTCRTTEDWAKDGVIISHR